MSSQKPGIPKGTRDFGPTEMTRRNYIFDTIRTVFKYHGYLPIETPAMENLDTLLGKYGEEGDKLLFKILNSGDFLAGVSPAGWAGDSRNALSLKICEKGLRYDLTVPFARFVVQHQHEIEFPFKRYQIQPVWRADRPQKGRYREFYQCDADVIGSNSLLNELDLIQIIVDVFKALNIKVKIKLNNRKILAGIAGYIGHPDRITDITIAIDKFEKIGLEAVNAELKQKGIDDAALKTLEGILFIKENTALRKLQKLKTLLMSSETGTKGIEEMTALLTYCRQVKVNSMVDFDLTLARGLNYYTGAIIEVKALDTDMGSICGGGRYDDLTGIFGLKNVSGVGISFGADRIYDVMDSKQLFPKETSVSSQVLFANFGESEAMKCLEKIKQLHLAGILSELYPDKTKLGKQLTYAGNRNIPYTVLAGENEITTGRWLIKNMISGKQYKVNEELLVDWLVGKIRKSSKHN
jgi:histidyl-tRNA synthetase